MLDWLRWWWDALTFVERDEHGHPDRYPFRNGPQTDWFQGDGWRWTLNLWLPNWLLWRRRKPHPPEWVGSPFTLDMLVLTRAQRATCHAEWAATQAEGVWHEGERWPDAQRWHPSDPAPPGRFVTTTEALMTDPTTTEGQAYWLGRRELEGRLEELAERRMEALAVQEPDTCRHCGQPIEFGLGDEWHHTELVACQDPEPNPVTCQRCGSTDTYPTVVDGWCCATCGGADSDE